QVDRASLLSRPAADDVADVAFVDDPAGSGPAGSGPAGSGPAGSGPAGGGPAGSGPAGGGPVGAERGGGLGGRVVAPEPDLERYGDVLVDRHELVADLDPALERDPLGLVGRRSHGGVRRGLDEILPGPLAAHPLRAERTREPGPEPEDEVG